MKQLMGAEKLVLERVGGIRIGRRSVVENHPHLLSGRGGREYWQKHRERERQGTSQERQKGRKLEETH